MGFFQFIDIIIGIIALILASVFLDSKSGAFVSILIGIICGLL